MEDKTVALQKQGLDRVAHESKVAETATAHKAMPLSDMKKMLTSQLDASVKHDVKHGSTISWQIGTYVSEHGTDMYVHVHEFTYSCEHVCTWYIHVHQYTYMYIHVHEFLYMHVHSAYMFMNSYSCMYIVHTYT